MSAPLDVLVVGAGPTGLMLAGELARRGVAVRIVEARTEPSTWSRAYGVHARTTEILDAIGLADDALAAGRRTVGANVYERRTHLFRTGMDHLPSRYPFLLSVPQFVTESLLERRLGALGARVERGVRVHAVRADEAGAVATVRSGDREEEVRARFVVGCDGARSAVRDAMGVGFTGRSYAEDWMLADLVVDWDLAWDELHGFVTPQGYVSFNPRVGERAFRLVFDVSGTDLAGRRDVTAADVQRVLDVRGLPGRLVGDLAWQAPFRTHRRIADRFRSGPLLLAGDAAHIHSPIGGQGMNAGIQDAWNLGWKLAAVLRGAPDAVLDTYESERRPVALRILASTDQANWLLTGRTRLRRAAVRAVGGVLGRIPWALRDMTTATSGVTLAHPAGALAQDHGGGGPGLPAGARVADADHPGFREASRTGRHLLITASDALADAAAGLDVVPLVVPGGPALAVVRPDLHVGLRGPARIGLVTRYLASVGALGGAATAARAAAQGA